MERIYTVLIVEDNEINIDLLESILEEKCQVIKAYDGRQALEIVKNRSDIAAIVLDLVMPVMNGFEFMEALAQIPEKSSIPVIVATDKGAVANEKKALALGAYDFVSKPYDPTIIVLRVNNAIEHSRLAAYEAVRYLEVYDGLTGIYNKKSFIRATRQMLNEEAKEDQFAIIRFDVTRFAMINAYYGLEEGDRLLRYMAQMIKAEATGHRRMTFGRLGADDFCICTRYKEIQNIYDGLDRARKFIANYDLSFNIVLIFGIYLITDKTMDVESMIGNANMAAKRIKGNYLNTVAVYDEKMAKQRERDQNIVNEMKNALETEQFVVFLQPKYNSLTGLPCGAEALIRWKHPVKGMVPPGVFIPVFESNGFVEPVDHYMWEHVCILIRKWLDEGIDPSPVSVNVSRVNLYNPDIVDEICELTDKYNIPKKLLQLEITESAYTDNTDMILDVINKFHDNGFTILMDDFGSGYSSLNVLKDMHVDVLKIDMKFFGKTENTTRAETIVSSVVRMAKWLDISTVAEGVETIEQVDFLRSIGCTTIQGYYYAKPMPVDEYETLVKSGEKFVDNEQTRVTISNSPEIDQLVANTFSPICISEVADGEIEIMRVNQAYYDLLGYEDQIMFVRHPMDRALEEYREGLRDAYFEVVKSHEDTEYTYFRYTASGEKIHLHIRLKFLNEQSGRTLVLCNFELLDSVQTESEDEEKIRRIIDMCREKEEKSNSGYQSCIAPCGHMPEIVNTVLETKANEKHALILVSLDNVEEAEKDFDSTRCTIFRNSIECMINQFFRVNDMVVQMGDNEYCVFMPSVPAREIVVHKCNELTRHLNIFTHISHFPVSLSMGVAISSKNDRDFEKLYETASEALKRGRESGSGRVYMMDMGLS